MNTRKKMFTFLISWCLFCIGYAQSPVIVNKTVKDGYKLVWFDEFNTPVPAMPQETAWRYETGGNGWGNNELQFYVAGKHEADTLAYISDGTLKIKALEKAEGGKKYVSVRMNTRKSWLYGYFEARAKLPGKRGTWPAFWMMPVNFKSWPLDGEIDIMEYVGYRPNIVQSSIHTKAYNHVAHTEKTATQEIKNAETEFHVYGLEWTPDYITGYVDGQPYFTFKNDGKGNKETWPFNAPFYLKLNLAIGGNWGGSKGIDPAVCPAVYEIDYVRVYQK